MINILITSADCSNPALGTFLLVAKRILQVIQIAGPIVLIVSLIVSFMKGAINPEDKKTIKKIFNSIIAMIVLFVIPILINVVMGALGENFTVSECWNSIDREEVDTNSNYKNPYDNKGKKKTKIIDDGDSEYEKGEPEEDTNDNEENSDTSNKDPEADPGKVKEDIERKK